jgi:hypothetical protein
MYLGPDGRLLPWPAIVTTDLNVKHSKMAMKQMAFFMSKPPCSFTATLGYRNENNERFRL